MFFFFSFSSRIAHFLTCQKTESPEAYLLIFPHCALYLLFQRLYGMYPCNFLAYLRHHYSQSARIPTFTQTIKPFIDHVKLHPLLITASKEAEIRNDR
jgi:tuberous sclerosis protein 1